jgi:hypothetical protein
MADWLEDKLSNTKWEFLLVPLLIIDLTLSFVAFVAMVFLLGRILLWLL